MFTLSATTRINENKDHRMGSWEVGGVKCHDNMMYRMFAVKDQSGSNKDFIENTTTMWIKKTESNCWYSFYSGSVMC